MTKIFDEYLTKIIAEYEGPKLSFIVAGGGSAVSRIASIPGASKVLHSMYCGYEQEAMIRLIERNVHVCRHFKEKAVSMESAWELARAWEGAISWDRDKHKAVIVAITGAITTNRDRRGKNEAFISIGAGPTNTQYHVQLGKLPSKVYEDEIKEWRDLIIAATREKEDEHIAMLALTIATKVPLPSEISKCVDLENFKHL